MKAIKLTDEIHEELTGKLGQLIAESAKIKTYADVIEALLHRSVILPSDLAAEIQEYISKNPQFGYSTKDEFVKEILRQALFCKIRKLPG
jgi:hypothetical protein